jgi:MoaA/NifB/PqqE/SkfB family radical SAM enzyme
LSGKDLKKSFCILPFTSVDARNDRIFGPCCKSVLTSEYYSIDSYWNSTELLQLQKDALGGLQNPICSDCWKIESAGLKSLRQTVNVRTKKQQILNPSISMINYNPGRECNLACMMCSESHSSKFASMWKGEMVPPPSQHDAVENHNIVSEWIYQNYNQLTTLTVNGGEPLYNKKFITMIDFLNNKNVAKNIDLYITTNATVFSNDLIKKLKKFNKVIFSVSVEAVGMPNNYIRWLSNFDKIKHNMEILNKEFEISIQSTISALNIVHLPTLIEFCNNYGYTIGTANLVEMWEELLPKNLPNSIKEKVDKRYSNLIKESGNSTVLIEFIKKWDLKRNIRIEDYMPEWKGIIDYNGR